jgi:N-acetylglucosamine-6-phosphate deacetylase
MICDLVHLHPTTIKLIYAAKGADKINVISDSSKVAGIEADEFYVGNVRRIVRNGAIYLEDGTIAGSTCTVLNGVKNLVKMGIPLSDISKMTSISPAKSLGLDSEIGSIEVGKCADMVVLDENIDVFATFVNGNCVYKKG